MKKNYFLAAALFIVSFMTFAQQEKMVGNMINEKPSSDSEIELKKHSFENFAKSPGDTIWYEDFGGGFSTNGWNSTNPSQSGFHWIYTTAAPGGQYSTVSPPIASTTGANGFALMRGDFYNTPTPAGGFYNMDSYLTSGPISLTPKGDIILQWQQSYRYCCNATTDLLEVHVSTDNSNWVTYDAKPGVSASTSFSGSFQANISSIAANQSVIYIRFYMSASHYFWMIDDIAVVEGTANQLELVRGLNSFGQINREGYFTMVPETLTQPLTFGGEIKNSGGLTANNVKLKVNVSKNSTVTFSDSSAMISSMASFTKDTFDLINAYNNTDGVGDYTIDYRAKGISPSYNPSLENSIINYEVTDTVFGKDYNVADGQIGPGSYLGGDGAGSGIGTRFNVGQATKLTSVSYFISTSTLNVGAEFKAKVYLFDTSQSTLNSAMVLIAENPTPYTIQSSDLGTWVSIRMKPDTVLPKGLYVAIAEQTNANTSSVEFFLGRSVLSELLQPNGETAFLSNFVNIAGSAGPNWNWISALPMIRMNFGDLLPVGIDEEKESINSFTVFPNPNDGQFKIEIKAASAKFNLSVRNTIGQVVYNDILSVNNSLIKQVDLSNLKKGVYFITLENGMDREVQKIIVH